MAGKKSIPSAEHDSRTKPVSDEAILKVAKEIVVKFIEVGRLSPGNFGETFDSIYRSVHDTVRS